MRFRLQKLGAFLIILFCFGCSDSVQHLTRSTVASPSEDALARLLRDTTVVNRESLTSWCQVDDFYTLRNHRLLWHKDEHKTSLADSMIHIIQRLEYMGLTPDDYHLGRINGLAFRLGNSKPDPESLAQLDLLLTDALFSAASHLRYGRIKHDSTGWKERVVESDSVILNTLVRAISRNSLSKGLQSLEPPFASYRALRSALRTRLDSMKSPFLSSSQEQLRKEIADLSLSMEQWRWENFDPGARYILVNIPGYRLTLVDGDSLEFESRVIVGTPYSQTPVLDGRISNFIVYPSWNVPRGIATRELLPKIKNDSAYLDIHSYHVLDIRGTTVHPDSVDWTALGVNYFPYLIRQAPGPFNALGLLKFNFVNDYNIFLHDTNAKGLFESNYRALSHGCIRIERALELARHIVSRENPYCSPRDFDRFMRQELSRQVSLKPVDLRIRYITCETLADGGVVCHPDIYGRNAKLWEAINCRGSRQKVLVVKNVVQNPGQADACL